MKRIIGVDLKYRHVLAARRKRDQPLTDVKNDPSEFLSIYPYENSFWNALVRYEQKTGKEYDFSIPKIKELINKDEAFEKILEEEFESDFSFFIERNKLEDKLKKSYFTDLKVFTLN